MYECYLQIHKQYTCTYIVGKYKIYLYELLVSFSSLFCSKGN